MNKLTVVLICLLVNALLAPYEMAFVSVPRSELRELAIAGILRTKEFVSLKESGETEWQKIVRPYVHVKNTDSAVGAMRFIQEKKNYVAMVVQHTGHILGIVTLEDDDENVRKVYAAKIKSRVIPTEKS